MLLCVYCEINQRFRYVRLLMLRIYIRQQHSKISNCSLRKGFDRAGIHDVWWAHGFHLDSMLFEVICETYYWMFQGEITAFFETQQLQQVVIFDMQYHYWPLDGTQISFFLPLALQGQTLDTPWWRTSFTVNEVCQMHHNAWKMTALTFGNCPRTTNTTTRIATDLTELPCQTVIYSVPQCRKQAHHNPPQQQLAWHRS